MISLRATSRSQALINASELLRTPLTDLASYTLNDAW